MDPFSLAVGITGLTALAATTVKVAKEYISSVKHGKEQVLALVRELEALQSNLTSLDVFLRNLSTTDLTFQHTSVLRSCATTCETKLNALYKKLGQVGNRKLSRYLWPLSKEEHEKAIKEMRALAQWIHFALTVDGCALLSRTSAEVLKVFEKQVESFRVLKMIAAETADLHEEIKDQTRMLQEDRQAKENGQILSWISKFEYSQKHHVVCSPRVDGTGEWLLNEPAYMRWRDDFSTSNILWCYGDPGSGKSVLTSLIIDELQKSESPSKLVAFHYLDYQTQHNQIYANILSSLLRQIVSMMPELPSCVKEAYNKHSESGAAISAPELEDLLFTVAVILPAVFIVIDALDECVELRYRKDLLQFIGRLKESQTIRIFVTSRSHLEDVNNAFQNYPQVEVKAHDSDLRSYIERELRYSDVFVDDELSFNVIQKVLGNAHGMFLLPILQLRTVLKEPTAGEMEDALKNLSGSLSEAFEQTVTRINKLPENRKRLGLNALTWICYSRRPLIVSELSDALSVRPDQARRSPKHQPSASVILECCQGLATVDAETSIIRLTHKAVRDYLTEPENNFLKDAEFNMATTCLTYLLFDPFNRGPLAQWEEINYRVQSNPLLDYASEYCRFHTRQAQKYEDIRRLTLTFLSCRGATASTNQVRQFILGRRAEYWNSEECLSLTALHVACSYGLEGIVRKLLSLNSFPIDLATKMGTTPLIKAASGGHGSIVNLLLQAGANPYLENWYGNALHCAAEAGYVSPIRELVKFGMSINPCEKYSRSPLECTMDNDHAEAFAALVDLGAELTPSTRNWSTCNIEPPSAFHLAVKLGSINVVNLILRKKWADVNSKSQGGFTALHFAAMLGDTQVLRRLLKAGANINAKDDTEHTALDFAIKHRHVSCIELLNRDGDAIVAVTN